MDVGRYISTEEIWYERDRQTFRIKNIKVCLCYIISRRRATLSRFDITIVLNGVTQLLCDPPSIDLILFAARENFR